MNQCAIKGESDAAGVKTKKTQTIDTFSPLILLTMTIDQCTKFGHPLSRALYKLAAAAKFQLKWSLP